jgi:Flp pilus assembly pilin Flp
VIDHLNLWALRLVGRLHREKDGQTMVEYVLILAAIAVFCIAAFGTVATKITSILSGIAADI